MSRDMILASRRRAAAARGEVCRSGQGEPKAKPRSGAEALAGLRVRDLAMVGSARPGAQRIGREQRAPCAS
jgi:hypothetical protein